MATQQKKPKDGDKDTCEDCGAVMVYVERWGVWQCTCECGMYDEEEDE